MSNDTTGSPYINNHLLVAMPGLLDPIFSKSVVYLAEPDPNRDDYKTVFLPHTTAPYQNSGLFAIHKKWFLPKYNSCGGVITDIDEIVLPALPLGHILLNTSIIDVGTPDRLKVLRGMVD